MKTNTHEIEGKTMTGNRLSTWLQAWSPFEFKTLKGIPWPTTTLPFAVFFFALIWYGYEKNFDNSSAISNELAEFVNIERSDNPYKPEIFIIGSSYAGMGTYTDLFVSLMRTRTSKVSISSGIFWESSQVIKKYQNELANVKLLIVELRQSAVRKWGDTPRYKYRFDFLKGIGWPPHPSGYGSIESLLPIRFSLKDINAFRQKTHTRTNGRERYWETLHKEKGALEYDKKFPQYRLGFQKRIIRKNEMPFEDFTFDEAITDQVRQFVDYCANRGIFVVFNVYPMETQRSVPLDADDLQECYAKYWKTLKELNEKPNCAVIVATCFHDIIPDMPKYYAKNPRLTFDGAHMTKNGATIYTEWLVAQMKKNPKIVAALEKKREPEEFFVKRYARDTWQTVAGYFKPAPTATPEEKHVELARPAAAVSTPIR